MDELEAAAAVIAMEVDSDSGDGLGLDDSTSACSARVLRESAWQLGSTAALGNGVAAAGGEFGDATKQVMLAPDSTASTPHAQHLARHDGTLLRSCMTHVPDLRGLAGPEARPHAP
jgi:hypothetical protein